MAEVDLSMAQKEALRAEVKELGDQIRALKEAKSDAELVYVISLRRCSYM